MTQIAQSTPPTGEWECTECGYIEEGVESRRPKQCPECEAPAAALEFFPYDDSEDSWGRGDDDKDELDEDELAEDDEASEDEY